MHVLVVGGAGYIGGHMVRCLRTAGHQVTVLDDLSSGRREFCGDAKLVVGNCGDRAVLGPLFEGTAFDAVMHFASFIQVGESVQKPLEYYRNNVAATLTLVEAVVAAKVNRFIFSSTAAVYGNPQTVPLVEDHPCAPLSPYGQSKRMMELVLQDVAKATGLRSVAFRYFNAAGASAGGGLGECHQPETHLIPLALQAASGGKPLTVFGEDWPTPDGTCVRDYVHVDDLARAHLLGVEWLAKNEGAHVFNLGTKQGFSVKQVLESVGRVVGTMPKFSVGPRRAGDPAVLVADASKAKAALGWSPQHADLDTIVKHAWAWEKAQHAK